MDPNWHELVESTGPVVYGIAWRILGHPQDAEDTVQDVFFEVHRLWSTRQAQDWRAVLRRMAVCRALDRVRQRRASVSADDLDLTEHRPGPQEIVAGQELEVLLREAIGRLPDREAEVFCLRFFDDRDYSEIAALLGITSSSVGTALHKARQKLETMLHAVVAEK